MLAIDVGAGTQDILVYESNRTIENCVKLVLPSQTQVIAGRVRRATLAGRPIHLAGSVMGGGASSTAVEAHLALGRLYRMRGEVGRAIRVHQNLLLRSDLAREHMQTALEDLAEDFRQGGFLQRAIASYEEVLARLRLA